MKTITFYSYKGGVGRSLALVNIATRLSEFGKKVCVIDFDLEAPGLHLKFPIPKSIYTNKKGIVDFVYEYSNKGILVKSIKDYSIEVQVSKTGKSLSLIPAGDVESTAYWKKLSSINWHELIYENNNGLAFLLFIKDIIKKEIKPDFLLIDSRTGISEMSGITLSLLADEVVIVAANNRENLSGAKKIIQSLNDKENNIFEKSPKINFVLSRIPFTEKPEDKAKESILINKIKREYLTPYLSEINIIHSDRELEEYERVKIGYEKDDSNTQISIDYLKLFEKLTENDLSPNEIRRFNNIRESEKLVSIANNTENPLQKIDYISKAIELNKTNIELYIYKANILFELKDFKKSLEVIEKGLALDQNNNSALNTYIDNLIELKDYQKASKEIDRYIEIRPNDLAPLILKIILLTRTKNYIEAEKVCSLMIEMNPEYSYGFSCRANSKRLLKNFDSAFEDIYKALELDSENLQAVATLAEIYAELGKLNEFFIHFESLLKSNADYAQKAVNDEEIYQTLKENERFLGLLSKYGIYLDKHN
ncbi:AAA family ATPase [Algoriphagus aestuariicola]|uniref:AAA family ATPase n=1 Tax=Algoriphagus aestuariicola TaxID=1852016 RepID=A0ABS3BUV6_9BACT|nr:AAA family ATPase [Algoriphagus aestuariicola]MBN7803083.1 AAA family ATPase [Algoriphagus aestuariicola]